MSNQETSDFNELQNQNKKVRIDRNSQSQDSACYQPGGSKFFGALENSAALEEPKFIYQTVPNSSISTEHPSQLVPQSANSKPLIAELNQPNSQPNLDVVSLSHPVQNEVVPPLSNTAPPLFEETISLLEERLVIDSQKRKVGEVIVRKEIETRIVEVPIRREKLIVEQVSPTFKQLAVVDLGQIHETEFDQIAAAQASSLDPAAHKFDDTNAAIQFLEAIASKSSNSQQTVHISVVLKDKIDLPFNS